MNPIDFRAQRPRAWAARLGLALCCATALALALALAQAPARAADSGPYVYPDFNDASSIKGRCDVALSQGVVLQAQLGRGSDESVLVEMERLNQQLEDQFQPLFFLANVHPDKAVRDAAEACELRYETFIGKLYQDARIFARLKALTPADAIDTATRAQLIEAFEDAGSALTGAARKRARRLNEATSTLSQTFERRVRETRTRVAFTEAELNGVPDNVWKSARRDAQGRVLLGLDYPSVLPVLDSARSAVARERMWRAFNERGGAANLQTLAELGQQRRAYARLFGLPSYADFALRRRMAQSVDKVQGFLGEVRTAVAPRELRDLDDLRAAKAAETGQPLPAVVIERWDQAYYTERVKQQRFALDQNAFRRYFPPQASADFVMAVAGRLFGVSFKPLTQTLWHPDARAYGVYDDGGRRLVATLFLDLYPREDKYSHAAMWSLRGSSTLTGRLPTAALVTNIDRNGLTISELETLLHEFGHALHGTLSATRYSSNAGTSVKLDFVEAPSQMLEEWVYDARVLALFQQVCPQCEPVPEDLLKKAVASRSFGKGLQYARQLLYASYDLAIYDRGAPDPMRTWARMEGATPLGTVKGSKFPAAFAHVAGGYGAGYYAYLWSLATAQDLYTAFAADPLSAEVGRRYREAVLSQGGQVDPNVLVANFLGRAPNSQAFFQWLNQ